MAMALGGRSTLLKCWATTGINGEIGALKMHLIRRLRWMRRETPVVAQACQPANKNGPPSVGRFFSNVLPGDQSSEGDMPSSCSSERKRLSTFRYMLQAAMT